MNKRSIVATVTVLVVAALIWLGGRVLWNAILAMHGQR